MNQHAHVPAPGIEENTDPDFFSNSHWMVGEIVLAHQILGRKISELRSQNAAKTSVGQKLAAEEVSRLAEQLKTCSDIIVRKSVEYIKRETRVRS